MPPLSNIGVNRKFTISYVFVHFSVTPIRHSVLNIIYFCIELKGLSDGVVQKIFFWKIKVEKSWFHQFFCQKNQSCAIVRHGARERSELWSRRFFVLKVHKIAERMQKRKRKNLEKWLRNDRSKFEIFLEKTGKNRKFTSYRPISP